MKYTIRALFFASFGVELFASLQPLLYNKDANAVMQLKGEPQSGIAPCNRLAEFLWLQPKAIIDEKTGFSLLIQSLSYLGFVW